MIAFSFLSLDEPQTSKRCAKVLRADTSVSGVYGALQVGDRPNSPMLILVNADTKGEWVAEMIKEGNEHPVFRGYTKEQVNASKSRFCSAKP